VSEDPRILKGDDSGADTSQPAIETRTPCPPHRFHLDHRIDLINNSLTVEIEIDGAIFREFAGTIFAYCPDCGDYLTSSMITHFLNEQYGRIE
jgi:hypothetical protein